MIQGLKAISFYFFNIANRKSDYSEGQSVIRKARDSEALQTLTGEPGPEA